MRPQLLKVSKGPDRSFSVRRDLVPHVNNRWHYHTEVELIHFKKGEGTQFIGDSIKRFKAGDVVLVGSNLPHYWRFDDTFFEENTKAQADIRVSHFNESFWGDQFLDLPENSNIRTILEKAKRGLQITGKTKQKVAELLEQLQIADGPQRIILLIEALSAIANCKSLVMLSSIGFKPDLVEVESDRINAVVQNLRAVGATAEELPDGLRVRSGRRDLAGSIDPRGDHRIAMSFAVLSAATGGRITVQNPECVAVSYPEFWQDLRRVVPA